MRRLWVALVGAAFGLAAAAGCADILGFKDLKPSTDDAATDASSDITQPDAGGDVDTCAHVRWPGASDASTPVDAGNYIIALHHLYFSSTPDGGAPAFGYDLDDHCTNANDPSSASCKSNNIVTDGVGGIDNASIQIMSSLSTFSFGATLTDTAINANVAAGNFSLVLHLNQYGGGIDQSRTTGLNIAVQGATGLESPATPQFDGNDRWIVNVDDSVSPATNTPKAFFPADVVGGVLVSTFNNSPVVLHVLIPAGDVSGVLSVVLHEPVMTAKIVKRNDGNFDLASGIIGGRWKTTDLLAALASLNVSNAPFCEYLDGGAQSLAQSSFICPNVDITSSGVDDGSEACDAIAVAMAFDAVSAQIATNPGSFNVVPTPCPFDAGGCN